MGDCGVMRVLDLLDFLLFSSIVNSPTFSHEPPPTDKTIHSEVQFVGVNSEVLVR